MKVKALLFSLICVCLLSSCTIFKDAFKYPSEAISQLELGISKKEAQEKVNYTSKRIYLTKDEKGDILEAIKFQISPKEYYRLNFKNDSLVSIEQKYVFDEVIKETFPDPKKAIEEALEEKSKE